MNKTHTARTRFMSFIMIKFLMIVKSCQRDSVSGTPLVASPSSHLRSCQHVAGTARRIYIHIEDCCIGEPHNMQHTCVHVGMWQARRVGLLQHQRATQHATQHAVRAFMTEWALQVMLHAYLTAHACQRAD